MKILITGATGFIGNHVLNELLDNNTHHQLIATSSNEKKAKGHQWFGKVDYIEADLNTKQDFYTIFNQPDLLIHLAWEGLPNYKELSHVEKNLPTNLYLLRNLVNGGLKKIVITGTCLEYGLVNGSLMESQNTFPQNPYALAKDSLRKYVELLSQETQVSYNWIRLFYMYGVGQSEKSLLSQLKSALSRNQVEFNMSGGEQLRDYLGVEDVAKYIINIALQNEYNGIINCCSGEPKSVRKLVEDFLVAEGKSIKLNLGYYPYPDYEPMAFWGNNTLLKQIINHDK